MRKVGSVDTAPKKQKALYVILVVQCLSHRKCKVEVYVFFGKQNTFICIRIKEMERNNEGKPSRSKEVKSAISFSKPSCFFSLLKISFLHSY